MGKVLTGQNKKDLKEAILSAFPSYADLKNALLSKMDFHYFLNDSFHNSSMENVSLQLISWTISKGNLEKLLNALRDENPRNQKLIEFYAWYIAEEPAFDPQFEKKALEALKIFIGLSKMNIGSYKINGVKTAYSMLVDIIRDSPLLPDKKDNLARLCDQNYREWQLYEKRIAYENINDLSVELHYHYESFKNICSNFMDFQKPSLLGTRRADIPRLDQQIRSVETSTLVSILKELIDEYEMLIFAEQYFILQCAIEYGFVYNDFEILLKADMAHLKTIWDVMKPSANTQTIISNLTNKTTTTMKTQFNFSTKSGFFSFVLPEVKEEPVNVLLEKIDEFKNFLNEPKDAAGKKIEGTKFAEEFLSRLVDLYAMTGYEEIKKVIATILHNVLDYNLAGKNEVEAAAAKLISSIETEAKTVLQTGVSAWRNKYEADLAYIRKREERNKAKNLSNYVDEIMLLTNLDAVETQTEDLIGQIEKRKVDLEKEVQEKVNRKIATLRDDVKSVLEDKGRVSEGLLVQSYQKEILPVIDEIIENYFNEK